ncbi:MAG: AMP-binding protein [Treponema sp.]|nr:AMP-binding protein [Treponema sp.]
MSKKRPLPWASLEEFRGILFNGEWPTFPELLEIQLKRFRDRPCFTDFDGPNGSKRTMTYNLVYEKVHILANYLVSKGLKKGDHVVVAGKNSPEWAISYLAVLCASGVVVPIADSLHNTEMGNIIRVSTPKFALVDDTKIQYIKENFPGVTVYSLNPSDLDNFVLHLEAEPVPEEMKNEPAKEDDLALLMFTSGTTGNPKGVMLTHKNIIADGYIAQTNLLILPTDVFYALLPIHHAYTMQAAFICPIEVGAEIVFGKSLAVTRLMKELKEGKISIMLGVPLLYNKLLSGINKGIKSKGVILSLVISIMRGLSFIVKKLTGKNIGRKLFKAVLEQANISTLRVAICGGGPLAKSVFRQYQEMGIDFIQGYGLTETSPIIALNPIEKFKIQSVGRDFSPYEEIKILERDDLDNEINKRGGKKIGEICVKGPMVMQGYYNMPKETAEMFTEDGFLKTGDLGWMDKDHYIMLCGRAKNLIVTSGGKNVYPEEIEDSFQLYYDVQQVTVRGYHPEGDDSAEEIEVLIYVSDDLYSRMACKRSMDYVQQEIVNEVRSIVSRVNKKLQPYEQITKITLLKEPLEMTPSQKVKRNYVANAYQQ